MRQLSSHALASTIGLIVSAALAGPAGAATQGTLGSTSTGAINIIASVAARTQITALQDVSFSAVDPSNAVSNAQSNCVWSNTLNGGYSITATGSGASGAFTLTNSAATVPYSVQWATSAGQSSGTTLSAGAATAGMTSLAVNPTCSTSPTTSSSLIIGITSASLFSMTANTTYAGTLTLLVTPQ